MFKTSTHCVFLLVAVKSLQIKMKTDTEIHILTREAIITAQSGREVCVWQSCSLNPTVQSKKKNGDFQPPDIYCRLMKAVWCFKIFKSVSTINQTINNKTYFLGIIFFISASEYESELTSEIVELSHVLYHIIKCNMAGSEYLEAITFSFCVWCYDADL